MRKTRSVKATQYVTISVPDTIATWWRDNPALFKSAPDLLEACKDCYMDMQFRIDEVSVGLTGILLKAIARAEGRET